MTGNCVRTHTYFIFCFLEVTLYTNVTLPSVISWAAEQGLSAIGWLVVFRDTVHTPHRLYLINESVAVIHPH